MIVVGQLQQTVMVSSYSNHILVLICYRCCTPTWSGIGSAAHSGLEFQQPDDTNFVPHYDAF